MKAHNYRPQLALLAAACSLAACGKSTPPSSSSTETSAATAVAEAPAPTSQSAIVAGLFHVCHVDPSAQLHNKLAGDHVPEGTAVFIRPIDSTTGTTLVCIGQACPADPTVSGVQDQVFWMSGDINRVQTVKEFAHQKSDPTPPVAAPPVRHLMQLMVESEALVPTQCKGKNVHVLRFCEWGEGEEGPTWLCEGEHPHAGTVHLEN
jgi:hypothetical protein